MVVSSVVLLVAQFQIPAWVPLFVAEMKEVGMLERYSAPHDRHGNGPTRYEYAVMTHVAFEQVKKGASSTGGEGVKTWWLKIDKLVDMVREFDRELTSMGAGSKRETILRLRKAQESLALAGAKQSSINPEWVEPILTAMKKEGLLVGYPDGLIHPRRPPTRWEYSVTTYATFMHLGNIHAEFLKQEVAHPEDSKAIQTWPALIDDLRRLFVEYRQELTAMGVGQTEGGFADVMAEIARLQAGYERAARGDFPDVPAGHWAAPAVDKLKKEGLIRGYPNGRFGGGKSN